jgi:hypothetical protein
MTASVRRYSRLALGSAITVLVLSVATCRMDMLLKPGAKSHPVLSVNPNSVRDSARAGSDDVKQSDVAITNAGDGNFSWIASKDKGWLSIDPNNGESPATMTVSMDAHGLAPGTYEGNVTVRATGAEDSVKTVSVTFVVQRAGLIVTPGAITHGTNVNSNESWNDQLSISNSGNGLLVWTASDNRPWITLGTVAGTGSGTVPVTISSAGLSSGTYNGEIVITAPGAEGSPERVEVTLNVFEPGLSVTPGSLHDSVTAASGAPVTKTLSIGNTGGGSITWTATNSRPWVSLSASAGSAPPSSNVTVTLNPAGLAPGTHRDTIVVISPQATNGSVRVPVQLDIVQPVLSVDPDAISDAVVFGDPTKQTHSLAITNGGRGEFSWSATKDADWIGLSATSGGGAATITVTLDPAGMAPGTYAGHIVVASPNALGSPKTVNVTLTVGATCGVSPVTPDVVVNGDLKHQDCIAPRRPGSRAELYSFVAGAGDEITLRMTAEFNAYLILTDGAGAIVAQNDECSGESRTACIKSLRVGSAGEYTVEATSSEPGETGKFTLSIVNELPPAPPQGMGQFLKDGSTPIAIGGTTSEDAVVFRATISDQNDADTVHLELELEPLGSPFTNVRTHQSALFAARNGNVTAPITAAVAMNTGYHWQARTCDRTGRCSAWFTFGQNEETTADFSVAPAPPPPPPPGAPPREQGSNP